MVPNNTEFCCQNKIVLITTPAFALPTFFLFFNCILRKIGTVPIPDAAGQNKDVQNFETILTQCNYGLGSCPRRPHSTPIPMSNEGFSCKHLLQEAMSLIIHEHGDLQLQNLTRIMVFRSHLCLEFPGALQSVCLELTASVECMKALKIPALFSPNTLLCASFC
jgi:hypothetical protein